MSEEEALQVIKNMPGDELQAFYGKLPDRAKLMIGSGIVNWQDVLPKWYIKFQEEV